MAANGRWQIAAALGALVSAQAGQVCDLSFTACPGRLSGGVIRVPPEIIRLDARLPFCSEYIRPAGAPKPLSLVLIIDNSGSMDENDPEAARFDVVSSLLGNLGGIAPSSQVGLVVFTRRLAFDHRENPLFRTAFPGDVSQHDSFVPLLPLDTVFADGRTGLDTLKAFLRHDARGNLVHGTQLPASRRNMAVGPSNTRDGTDITLGFEAARLALADSRSAPGDRFFVFLSDGTPAAPDYGREALAGDFVAGRGVPTTFTIFFDTRNSIPAAPETIVRMTSNIRANGYSETNPASAFWAIGEPGGQLDKVLRENVLGNVFAYRATPAEASLSTGDSLIRSAYRDGDGFVFDKSLNLRADTTRLELGYSYTYVDSSAGRPRPAVKRTSYALTLVRSPAAVLPPEAGRSCREQPDLGLFRNGIPVTEITYADDALEARVMPRGGSACPACRLEASPGGGADLEIPPLEAAGSYLRATLRRIESAAAVPGDGLLQHAPADSIVIRYVDPQNPLDVVRRAYPYRAAPAALALRYDSGFVRPGGIAPNPLLPQFVVYAPPGLAADKASAVALPSTADAGPIGHFRTEPPHALPAPAPGGLILEASRAFSVDLAIFSNLGQPVNRLRFSVGAADFERLEPVPGTRNRRLRLRWDGRAANGGPVGTGAYVMKATARLAPAAGAGGSERTVFRRIGVLR